MNTKLYQYAINLLSRQDYSEFKLRKKLQSRIESIESEIDEVLLKLKDLNYLREDNYKKNFIKKWLQKGESEHKIRFRGSQEGLNFESEDFRLILEETCGSSEESINQLIEKKLRLKNVPDNLQEKFKLREKILRFLLSKGHSYDDAHTALKKYL